MKAVIHTKYGPPEILRLEEIPKPEPADNEVLIRVRATTVTAGDYRMRGFNVPGLFWLPGRLAMGIRGPRKQIPGSEFAGVAEDAGPGVTTFKAGDEVFGTCGAGTYAEYICMPEDGTVALKPANMTFEEAAAVPFGSISALYFLRNLGNIQSGQKVLINGASGGVGTAAVQLAKHYGADVTGICSTANLELVASLGADTVIDYMTEDFTQRSDNYDIIFDTVGNLSYSKCKHLLNPNGVFLAAVIGPEELAQMLLTSVRGDKKVEGSIATNNLEDLLFLKGLVEAGELRTVIDRCYPLEEAAEAHRYAEQGHKKGNVVITVGESGKSGEES